MKQLQTPGLAVINLDKNQNLQRKKKRINETMHFFISRMWSFFCCTRSIKSQILWLITWIAHLQEAKESIYSHLCPFLLLPHSPPFSYVVLLPVPLRQIFSLLPWVSHSVASVPQNGFYFSPWMLNFPFHSFHLCLCLLTQSNKGEQIQQLSGCLWWESMCTKWVCIVLRKEEPQKSVNISIGINRWIKSL